MLYPDLAARTCGFLGVMGSLIILGIIDSPEFLITPQVKHSPLVLELTTLNASAHSTSEASSSNPTPSLAKGEPEHAQSPASSKEVSAHTQNATSLELNASATTFTLAQDTENHTLAQTQAQSSASPEPAIAESMSRLEQVPEPAPKPDSASKSEPVLAPEPEPKSVPESIKQEPVPEPKSAPKKPEPALTQVSAKAPTATQTSMSAKGKVSHQTEDKAPASTKAPVPARSPSVAPAVKQQVTSPQHTAKAKANAKPSQQEPATRAPSLESALAHTAQQQQAEAQMQSQVANLLVQEIKRKLRYPRNAVRRKLEGIVQVEFRVQDGQIVNFSLSKSSGHKILDEAARKLAQGMLQMRLPVNVAHSVVVIPIKYELL